MSNNKSLIELRKQQKYAEREAKKERLEAQARRLRQALDNHRIYRGNVNALAHDVKMANQTLHCYVKGTRELPIPKPGDERPTAAERIAACLGLSFVYLTTGKDTIPAPPVNKLSQNDAVADKSLTVRLYRSIDLAYFAHISNGTFPHSDKMTTIQNAEVVFGADIPQKLYGLIGFPVLIDPDARPQSGDTVHVAIPALGDSLICRMRQERQTDGTFRTLLVQENGEEIEMHPEAGDRIIGVVWCDLIRRK